MAEETKNKNPPYWMAPFETYKTMCPYLVGTYKQVAEELSRYMTAGHRKFILDIPPCEEELHQSAVTFEHAAKEFVSCLLCCSTGSRPRRTVVEMRRQLSISRAG